MPRKKARSSRSRNPLAAYQYFGLKLDPFTTLSLQPHNLPYFTGREREVDRLSAALFALHNVGLAGEAGSGKSSLLQRVRSRVTNEYHTVMIGSPRDDSEYFLTELLRELLLLLPGTRVGFSKGWEEKLGAAKPGKNTLLAMVKRLLVSAKKPVLVFVDDMEKIQGDRVSHWTRSERTLQVLEELKPVFEMPKAAFAVSLQDEFYAKVGAVVRDGADPTVLGLFKTVVHLEPFGQDELKRLAETRLTASGLKEGINRFFEPEALKLALSLSHGNPRRFLFLLSEASDRAFLRRGPKVEFLDLFEAVNEHLRLDAVCRKLLYFLAKSGRAMAANGDLQAFLGMDAVSLNRRFEILVKNRLADRLDVSGGSFVYGLPGSAIEEAKTVEPEKTLGRSVPFKDERMFLLDEDAKE